MMLSNIQERSMDFYIGGLIWCSGQHFCIRSILLISSIHIA